MKRQYLSEKELAEYIKDFYWPLPSKHEITWYVVDSKVISDERKHYIVHENFRGWCHEHNIEWY